MSTPKPLMVLVREWRKRAMYFYARNPDKADSIIACKSELEAALKAWAEQTACSMELAKDDWQAVRERVLGVEEK